MTAFLACLCAFVGLAALLNLGISADSVPRSLSALRWWSRYTASSGSADLLEEGAKGTATAGDRRLLRRVFGRIQSRGVTETLEGFKSSFQPCPSETTWATGDIHTVGDGKTYTTLAAAFTAAGDGDLIECYDSTASAYHNQGELLLGSIDLTVHNCGSLDGTTWTGTTRFYVDEWASASLTLVGIKAETTYGALVTAEEYSYVTPLTLKRCWFVYQKVGAGHLVYLDESSSEVVAEGCIFQKDSAHLTSIRLLRGAATMTVKNCVLHSNSGSSVSGIDSNSANTTFNVYNCAFLGLNTDISNGGSGTNNVNYCATTNASLPGDGDTKYTSIAWEDHFNDEFEPAGGSELITAGYPAQAAEEDFYSNTLSDSPVPIGAIMYGFASEDGRLSAHDNDGSYAGEVRPTELLLGNATTPELQLAADLDGSTKRSTLTTDLFRALCRVAVGVVSSLLGQLHIKSERDDRVGLVVESNSSSATADLVQCRHDGAAVFRVTKAGGAVGTHQLARPVLTPDDEDAVVSDANSFVCYQDLSAGRTVAIGDALAQSPGTDVIVKDGCNLAGTYNITVRGADAEPAYLDNAEAVDAGSGMVDLPIPDHDFTAGQYVQIAGTTNYNGWHRIEAVVEGESIRITATYVAEEFDGTETATRRAAIDGAASAAISSNRGSLHVITDGQNWHTY